MEYVAKNYEHLKGLTGFSDKLLETHFTLYNGYVTNTNKLNSIIGAMIKDSKSSTPEFAELKRRYGWEFNGMRLHELYFDQMSKSPTLISPKDKLYAKIIEDFGSYDLFLAELKAVSTMRGIGWAVLYYDLYSKKLQICWISEHDVGHLSTCAPLLIIDVFEHSFIIDYGIKRADYIESFLKILDWSVVEERYSKVAI